MDDPFEHCRRLIAQADKERYWASLYAPSARRPALHALYAFNVEVARVREAAHEPLAGEIRLQWWREVLFGERSGESAAHPVATALLAALQANALAPATLLPLIEARSYDLYNEPMARIADLEVYLEATAGTIFSLAARLLGGQGAMVEEICRRAGLAHGYGGLLRVFARHAARGQLYVPLEVLDRFGADRADIAAGRASVELRAALAEMRLRARRHLAAANDMLGAAPAAIFPALLPAAMVRPALARMEKPDYAPFADKDAPAWRRQWTIWRAARTPRRIFN